MHSSSIFDAKTSHRQTWTHKTHKTHHGPDLKEAVTFPLIVYFVPSHGANIQMSFCPKVETPATLKGHNFVCRPLIDMRFEAVVALVEIFPTICCTPPARKEIKATPDF